MTAEGLLQVQHKGKKVTPLNAAPRKMKCGKHMPLIKGRCLNADPPIGNELLARHKARSI